MIETSIPNDTHLLQQLLKEQMEQLKEQREQNKQLREQLASLQNQLAQLQQLLFGQKSEKRRDKKKSDSKEEVLHQVRQSNNGSNDANGRRSLPTTLEKIKIIYDLPESEKNCPCCELKLQCIGKEVSQQLDFIPAKLITKEHVRYKYACRFCPNYKITAPMPLQPIDRGLAGAGLLAEILINKYDDALPLYRQQERWKRLGYELPRSTLCDWVIACGERLKPIVDAMIEQCLLKSWKIHTDDTPIPVLAPEKTHTGRLWVYIAGGGNIPPAIIYQYSKTRSQHVPVSFLKNYQGYLQADAYPGYDILYKDGKIIEVACFAHARRKFSDIAKSVKEPTLANTALDFIAQLYGIEKVCKNMTQKQRYFYRRRYARPILLLFNRWLKKNLAAAPPKSPMALAITYCLNHWKALNNYLLKGFLDIDNNAAERAIRPLVIGRKNYLFAGSHKGAEMGAVIYSLIETCKLFNINPFDYLKNILERLPNTLDKNISDLFPCFWKPNST